MFKCLSKEDCKALELMGLHSGEQTIRAADQRIDRLRVGKQLEASHVIQMASRSRVIVMEIRFKK